MRIIPTVLATSAAASACTMILVGHKATTTGAGFAMHTDDAGYGASDYRLVKVPAADWPENSWRPVYNYANGYPRFVAKERGEAYTKPEGHPLSKPMGYIPQVNHTYAYLDQDYGMINEKQLAIAESTTSARTAGWSLSNGGKCLFGIDALTRVALERCDSAKCAVDLMGSLAVEHGFYSADSGDKNNPDFLDAGEALGLVDKYGEVWIFNVITGVDESSAFWAAQKLDPSMVHVNANDLTIQEINFTDTENFRFSPNMTEIAQKQGWYDPSVDGPNLNFWKTFAKHETAPGHNKKQYVWRRQWRIYSKIAPSQGPWDPNAQGFPVQVKPDKKLSLEDALELFRDYYQGTDFDLTKGIAAGPFGNPYRYDTDMESNLTGYWERAVSIDRGLFSFVAMSRPWLPDHIGAVTWFGWDWPAGAVYHPIYVSQTALPEGYDIYGAQSKWENQSSWRPFNALNNWQLLRYDVMSNETAIRIANWEKKGMDMANDIEDKAKNMKNATEAINLLTTSVNAHVKGMVEAWWSTLWEYMTTYANNWKLTGEGDDDWVELGYPDWWLQATEYVVYPNANKLSLPLKSPELCSNQPSPVNPSNGGTVTLTTTEAYVFVIAAVALVLVSTGCTALYYRRKLREATDPLLSPLDPNY